MACQWCQARRGVCHPCRLTPWMNHRAIAGSEWAPHPNHGPGGQLSSRASQRPWSGLLRNARCGPMAAGNWFEIRIVQWPPSDSRSPRCCVGLPCLFPPFFLRRRKLTFPVATNTSTHSYCTLLPDRSASDQNSRQAKLRLSCAA